MKATVFRLVFGVSLLVQCLSASSAQAQSCVPTKFGCLVQDYANLPPTKVKVLPWSGTWSGISLLVGGKLFAQEFFPLMHLESLPLYAVQFYAAVVGSTVDLFHRANDKREAILMVSSQHELFHPAVNSAVFIRNINANKLEVAASESGVPVLRHVDFSTPMVFLKDWETSGTILKLARESNRTVDVRIDTRQNFAEITVNE